MTTQEFITQFDILYNNIASNIAPSVDNYEKSVFLTQAQRDIVIELYTGRNPEGLSFESTEEARTYLRNLIKDKEYKNPQNSTISLDNSILFIIREEATFSDTDVCIKNAVPTVVPIRHDDLDYVLKNPYLGPSKRRVIRTDDTSSIKLYSKYNLASYKIYYIETPSPIILEDLDGVTIEGESNKTECKLHPILHKAILERAVALAKMAYIGSGNN